MQDCRCDNAGEQLLLDLLDLTHDQNKEGICLAHMWKLIVCTVFLLVWSCIHACTFTQLCMECELLKTVMCSTVAVAASLLCETDLGGPIYDPSFNKTCIIAGQAITPII